MATLAAPITNKVDLMNPNVVKVVVNALGHALYFSRAPIPWKRDGLMTEEKTGRRCAILVYMLIELILFAVILIGGKVH